MTDQIILDKFSERLFKLIKDNGTDINALAKALGIKSKSTIYRYMNGEMSPKLTTIKYLAEYFNVNEVWLMGYDVPIERNSFRFASSNGIDIDGLDEEDIKEINEFVKFIKSKKKNTKEG